MKKVSLLFCLVFLITLTAIAQEGEVDHSYKPLKLNLNESGSKYVRLIIWHQQWLTSNNRESDAKMRFSTSVRRSRFLAYAQVSPRFLILTHFGLNGLNQGNATSLGNNGDAPQLFLHGAWTEFKVSSSDALYVGTGLHYWKGLTRLANASTLNFMTLDQARPFTQWHSLGVTDQFARHIGIYAKGQIGQFDYRIALNNPINPANSLGAGVSYDAAFPNAQTSNIAYTGAANTDSSGEIVGNTIIEGYFRYNLFDTESIKLPYQVGTYHGKKKVLGFGLGFFSHGNGAYNTVTNEHESVFHIAGDVFYDAPLGGDGNAINAYASATKFDYGENYVSRWAGTGSNVYAQVGYFLSSLKLMPYIAYQSGSYDALEDNISSFDIGANYYVNGHHAKITLEYHTIRGDYRDAPTTNGDVTQWRLQTHIFL